MEADYKNWMPKGMIRAAGAGAALCAAGTALLALGSKKTKSTGTGALAVASGIGALGCAAFTAWSLMAYKDFSYDGERKLSRQVVDGVASYITLPDGGVGRDVGCGSGALTIACAKKNPQGRMVGIDRWGIEYASYSQELCESNAKAEGVKNVDFRRGDAAKLPFADESFDAVTSNYVYHNIVGKNRQNLLRETLRVLKKGGVFALHDVMGTMRYGDMQAFVEELQRSGYESVVLLDTSDGLFMDRREAAKLFLTGSMLLFGRK